MLSFGKFVLWDYLYTVLLYMIHSQKVCVKFNRSILFFKIRISWDILDLWKKFDYLFHCRNVQLEY